MSEPGADARRGAARAVPVMLSACPDTQQLEAFLTGDLPAPEVARLQEHLACCTSCLDAVRTLRSDTPVARAARAGASAEDISTEVGPGLAERLAGAPSSPRTAPEGAASEIRDLLDPPGGPDEIGRFGPYRVLSMLGAGGMGVVCLARDTRLKRRVALKFLRGAHSGDRLARFRREAELAARLQHPHIVQLYEAGEHGGRPFLAMEYVEGESLARRLADRPLAARAAAELVETLARAVDAAHREGVVHRDLKPANVLLAACGLAGEPAKPQAAESVPKIADFGLAKQLDDDAATYETQSGVILGTPGYMAPEQAWSTTRLQPLGPACDIWALGAILYECLTGRPPFKAASVLETLELIRTADPVPPRRLQPGVPRDLETVCLKCLQKQPARRYATAGELAADLRRFLNGEPVRARPASALQRLGKWARRRPTLAALLGVSAAAALALLVGGLVYQARLRRALENAQEQRARAEDHYEKMLRAVDVLLSEVGEVHLANVPEMEEARARLLEEALRFYRQLGGDKDNPDPAVRRETGRALDRTATIQLLLRRLPRAEADAREARALLGRLAEEFPGEPRYRNDLARACFTLARVVAELDHPAETESLIRQAIALWEAVAPGHPECRWDLALSYSLLAIRVRDRDPKEALKLSERARELALTWVRDHPYDTAPRRWLALINVNLGIVQQRSGDFRGAEASYRQARAVWEELAAPPAPAQRIAPAVAAQGLALPGGAAAPWQAALASRVALLDEPAPHPVPANMRLGEVYHNLAVLCGQSGRPGEAEYLSGRALAIRREVVRRNPRLPEATDELAVTLEAMAGLCLVTGRPDQARARLREAVAVREPLVRDCPAVVTYAERLARDYVVLARHAVGTKPAPDAEALYRKARALLEPLVARHPESRSYRVSLGQTLCWLAVLLGERKRYEEALPLCTRAIDLLKRAWEEDRRDNTRVALCGAHAARARIYLATGRNASALPDLQAVNALNAAPRPKNRGK